MTTPSSLAVTVALWRLLLEQDVHWVGRDFEARKLSELPFEELREIKKLLLDQALALYISPSRSH